MKLKGALRRAIEKKLDERKQYKKTYDETYQKERPTALRERAIRDAKADAYGKERKGKYGNVGKGLGFIGQMGKNLADSPYGMGGAGVFDSPKKKKRKKKKRKSKTITINLRR